MIRFKSQLGRDSSMVDLVPDYVSFVNFLPNSMKFSPLKRDHSMTNQTAKYYPKLAKYYSSTLNATNEGGEELDSSVMNKILFTQGSKVLL
jgi:hypothetical protein